MMISNVRPLRSSTENCHMSRVVVGYVLAKGGCDNFREGLLFVILWSTVAVHPCSTNGLNVSPNRIVGAIHGNVVSFHFCPGSRFGG